MNYPGANILHWVAIGGVFLTAPLVAPLASAITFDGWRSATFTAEELADPAISGTMANLMGDGANNFLKYAFDLDPHANIAGSLTPVCMDAAGHLQMTFIRRKDTIDLAYVPQVCFDLVQRDWVAGPDFVQETSAVDNGDGITETVTVRDLESAATRQKRFMRLVIGLDTDQDGLPDSWEMEKFGTLDYGPADDVDLDSFNNLAEYRRGMDPTDYYNGIAPILALENGNNQTALRNNFLPAPLVASVKDSSGQPINNAPVYFTIGAGGGMISPDGTNETCAPSLVLRTGTDGMVQAYLLLGSTSAAQNSVTARTGGGTSLRQVTFLAQSIDDTDPAAPTDVTCTRQSATEVLITWTDNSNNETGFYVERTDNGVDWVRLATLPANTTSFTDDTGVEGRAYYCRVVSYNQFHP